MLTLFLDDPAPGLRRLAAVATGRLARPQDAEALLRRARDERFDEARLALAVAAARCGAPASEARRVYEGAMARRMATWNGVRAPLGTLGWSSDEAPARRWLEAAGEDGARPVDEVRREAGARLARDPEDVEALMLLAAQQDPRDLPSLLAWGRTAGRRQAHAQVRALGVHGDPRARRHLLSVLTALDVDPGHGFAGRRHSGLALGRLGHPGVAGALIAALEAEALDHEGRPGAGLGIQFPVRPTLLYALGECGARATDVLAAYLCNTAGAATGGFYLPAMDALWKTAREGELLALLAGEETAAANAVGVLGARGLFTPVRAALGDPRPQVARAAHEALALAAAGLTAPSSPP